MEVTKVYNFTKNFTKNRFLDFPLRQQHKKSSELLRHVYDLLLRKQPCEAIVDHYNELQRWMNAPKLTILDFKVIANTYHHHLQEAQINIRENNLLPNIRTGDKPHSSPLLPIAIYLDNIRSAFNVGSIIRTTEAFALGSLYFAGQTPFIDNRQVQNTSMDSCHWLPCYKDIPLESLPRPIIAMDTSSEAICIHDFVFPETFTLILGNEEYGCSDYALKNADYLIEIPLCGKKNSLNVANAFAIAAAEIQRQNYKKVQDEN